MSPCLFIPLLTAVLLIPFATGGNPIRTWGETIGLLAMTAGAGAAIHILATLTHSYP